jgi:hypothetical protein
MFSQSNLRYRGTDHKIIQQLKKEKTEAQKKSLFSTYRTADATNTSTATNTTQPQFVFFNSAPVNGTSLCEPTSETLCEQFYVTQNDDIILQGASSVTSTFHTVSAAKRAVDSCGDVYSLENFIKNLLAHPSEPVFGNQSCTVSAYSNGRTVHLDNYFAHVAPSVCAALSQQNMQVITPCVQTNVHNAFDSTNSVINSHTSINPVFFYMPAILMSTCMLIGITMRRRHDHRRRREARERGEVEARQRQENPISLAEPAAVIMHEEVEMNIINIVPSQEPHVTSTHNEPLEEVQTPRLR